MNRDLLSKAVGGIDERYIAEALATLPEGASEPSERIGTMKIKRIVTLALAAVLLLSLGIVAHAAYSAVSTPEAAEKVAREQIEVWKEMGILSPEVVFEGPADAVMEFEQVDGNDYWYGRVFPHRFDVRWYLGQEAEYGCSLSVDTMTGKITAAHIDARSHESEDTLVYEDVYVQPVDPTDPEGETEKIPLRFYTNFDDIVTADMTVDRFCGLLAEYWGFTGYELADTDDYGEHWEAVDGSTLLTEMCTDVHDNYYLTVFFDGDQEGAPMYLQMSIFPGYVTMTLGTGHLVG